MPSGGQGGASGEIFIEYVVLGNAMRVTAIDGKTGEEVSIVAPANAPRGLLAEAAKRKLDYVLKKKQGGA